MPTARKLDRERGPPGARAEHGHRRGALSSGAHGDPAAATSVGGHGLLARRLRIQRVEVDRRKQELRETALRNEVRYRRARIGEQNARADAADRALGILL